LLSFPSPHSLFSLSSSIYTLFPPSLLFRLVVHCYTLQCPVFGKWQQLYSLSHNGFYWQLVNSLAQVWYKPTSHGKLVMLQVLNTFISLLYKQDKSRFKVEQTHELLFTPSRPPLFSFPGKRWEGVGLSSIVMLLLTLLKLKLDLSILTWAL
jgi:hypothetical protein